MRSGVSLNVAGVRPETLGAAREAARRSGLSLAQWLNSAIIGTAAEVGVRPPRLRTAPPDDEQDLRGEGGPFAAVNDRLDELAERLDTILTRNGDHDPSDQPAAGRDAIGPSLRAIETRLSTIARDLVPTSQATTQALAGVITRLNAQLDRLIAPQPTADPDRPAAPLDARPPPPSRQPPPAATKWPSGLGQAVAEISARQRTLDTEPARAAPPASTDVPARAPEEPATVPDMSRLEHYLRSITQQIETLRQPSGVEDAVAGLRQDLSEIGRKLGEAQPRQVLDAFQAEVRSLGERLEKGPQGGGDSGQLANIERGLSDVRNALNALTPAESLTGFGEDIKALSQKVELVAASGPDPATIKHLGEAIAELHGVAGRFASGEALSALGDEIRGIGGNLERFIADEERLGGIEQLAKRMEVLAGSIESRAAGAGVTVPSQLEALIKTLTERLETTRSWGGHDTAFEALETRIVGLAQKLDASDARLGNLATIEHNITDLIAQLKEARSAAIEAAESAAKAVAQEMLSARSGADEDVEALRHDIDALRTTQSDIDRRTEDTLEAVHGTLERLVERLAQIEADLNTGGPQGAMKRGEAPGRPDMSLPERVPPAPLTTSAETGRVDAPPPAGQAPAIKSPERRGVQVGLPDDHPLEPGSGSPRARLVASPAERIAASEAALGPAKPQTEEPGAKANFIAAARRAAQAATENFESTDARESSAKRGLLASISETLSRRRGPLMIGLALFVLALGTVQLVTGMLGSSNQTSVDVPSPASGDATAPAPSEARPDPVPGAAPPAPNLGRQSDATPADGSLLSPTPAAEHTSTTTRSIAAGSASSPLAAAANQADITGSVAQPLTLSALQAPPLDVGVPPPALPGGAAEKLPVSIGGPALRTAAAADNPAAHYEIAMRYSEGRGVPQSFEEAARWFQRAASHGLAPAQYRLGSLFEKGQGVKKDLEAALKLYRAAADQGNGKAMHNLAVLYAEGSGGKPDYKTASQWFRKAAEHGVSDSQFNLGILYARGIGVDQNLAESFKWFSLAAQQGDQDAAKKRDDVAGRLDAQSLVAAKLAVQTFAVDPEPNEAIAVNAPPGGWDQLPRAKPKPPARHLGTT